MGALALLCGAAASRADDARHERPAASLTVRAGGGASAAGPSAPGYALVVRGNRGVSNRVRAWSEAAGRLYVSDSNGGIEVPRLSGGAPDPECRQESQTAISCEPGHIAAIYGNLGDADDVFKAAPDLAVPLGVVLGGRPRFLDGGAGPDRLTGGAAADQLRGGGGADVLRGWGGPDSLYGGGGPDRINGGEDADYCNGGSKRDTAGSCEVRRKIP